MLNALKIGLLALMPLSVAQSGNSWTLTPQQASSQLTNTFEYISSNSLYDKITLVYNDISYTYSSEKNNFATNGYYVFSDSALMSEDTIRFYSSSDYITSDYPDIKPYSFAIIGSTSEYIAFTTDLIINGNGEGWVSANTEGLTQALEQDIETTGSMPSISDIFGTVTNSITAFIGSLGNAFTSVTSLFYANGQFTFLGVLILIGVGVGLVYGAYRLIKGLLHRV